jgi:hypothetical protein
MALPARRMEDPFGAQVVVLVEADAACDAMSSGTPCRTAMERSRIDFGTPVLPRYALMAPTQAQTTADELQQQAELETVMRSDIVKGIHVLPKR